MASVTLPPAGKFSNPPSAEGSRVIDFADVGRPSRVTEPDEETQEPSKEQSEKEALERLANVRVLLAQGKDISEPLDLARRVSLAALSIDERHLLMSLREIANPDDFDALSNALYLMLASKGKLSSIARVGELIDLIYEADRGGDEAWMRVARFALDQMKA